jgi:MtN3 and saliva related transmembrane protein
MHPVELLSLIAGLMTMAAPAAQAIKTIRTRHTAGLAVSSYVLLLCLGSFAVLIGVQYHIFFMILLNAIGTLFNVCILFLLSRRALAGFVVALLGFIGIGLLVAPWFMQGLITTRWAEPVGFVYGLVAAATFLPQVLLTWKTRSVAALSLPNLVLFSLGMTIWIAVAIVLHNWSLIIWNGILFVMITELLRMKIMVERRASRAPVSETAAEVVLPSPLI